MELEDTKWFVFGVLKVVIVELCILRFVKQSAGRHASIFSGLTYGHQGGKLTQYRTHPAIYIPPALEASAVYQMLDTPELQLALHHQQLRWDLRCC